ncbi:MAG TPA: hypothetical protein VJ673_06570 [Aromatoleum sp.]|uniref:hypothetical protein n=1 Tax=Aromatoleum sp. TaxID=2307007 RepID=UPI002B4A89FA|nr:hypothetical protein [Aromatoleum sp.]HJV25330.1 hypothetical protein [Aromatoleum sp.]
MPTDRAQLSATEQANQHPLNQAAASFLRKTDWGASPHALYCLSLMRWGLDNGLRVKTIVEPAYLLLQLEDAMGPLRLTRLASGEALGEENLTAEHLLQETDPLDAASLLLESLLDNRAAMP